MSTSPEEPFSIFYNSTEIPISKYKFALYSRKFQRCPELTNSNSLKTVGDAPLSTFTQFLAGAQGEEMEISEDTCLDLLQLAKEWEAPTVEQTVADFISKSPNYDAICARLQRRESNEPDTALEGVLAKHLNKAILLPSFSTLPLPVLDRILNSRDAEADAHELLKFVLKMFEVYKGDASILARAIDIRRLSSEEAEELLGNPFLRTDVVGPSLGTATLDLIRENREMRERMEQTDQTLRLLIDQMKRFEESQTEDRLRIAQLSMKIDKMKQKAKTRAADVANEFLKAKEDTAAKLVEVEKKAHSDLRKTNKIVNGLTRKSTEYDDVIKTMPARLETQRQTLTMLSGSVARLEVAVADLQEGPKKYETIDLDFEGKSFVGIMDYLNTKAGQNASVAGMIEITGSTTDHNEPYYVADMGWDDLWFTEDLPDQWLMYNFKDMRVKVKHYTLKTHKYPSNTPHIKTWVVEGSRDGYTWVELDKRSISVLNGPSRFQTFPCRNSDGVYRFVRLRQTAANARNDNVLALTNFEIFGDLLVPEGSEK